MTIVILPMNHGIEELSVQPLVAPDVVTLFDAAIFPHMHVRGCLRHLSCTLLWQQGSADPPILCGGSLTRVSFVTPPCNMIGDDNCTNFRPPWRAAMVV